MSDKEAVFEGWAIIEIMGHNREAGYVRTEYFGGQALFRVDQPEIPARDYTLDRPQWIGENADLVPKGSVVQRSGIPGKTVFVGPSSVFRMTPCDEAAVRAAIEQWIAAPVRVVKLAKVAELTEGSKPICSECGAVDCDCHTMPF